MPGLIASEPPRSAARGRDQDRLVIYLLLTGNSVFTSGEYMQVAADASRVFYNTPGSLTNALRMAADSINQTLLVRNMGTSSRGQYAMGWVTLGALRESAFTFLLSGPMHVYVYKQGTARHIFEPGVSGKGLGITQSAAIHYAQTEMEAGTRIVFCGKVPAAWESALNDPTQSSLQAMRRRLTTITNEDLNAVLIQATDGIGRVTLLSGTAELPIEQKEEVKGESSAVNIPAVPPASPLAKLPHKDSVSTPAQTVAEQPPMPAVENTSPLAKLPRNTAPLTFPASIPRANPPIKTLPAIQNLDEVDHEALPAERPAARAEESTPQIQTPREPSENARRAARTAASFIQNARHAGNTIGERLKNFLPRLLPSMDAADSAAPSSNTLMVFISVLIPLIVVTVASVVYLRYGRSQQYETYLRQAQQISQQADSLSTPIEQRKAWENVLLNVEVAESHRQTSDTIELRKRAETRLDELLGITRLQFNPMFSSSLGIEISRLAASESDIFMLNAANGEVLRAQLTSGRGFQLDTTFNCRPGVYGNYTVGPLVDILAMPTLNSINATLLGIDASGNLLYCAPGQVAQAIPLPTPDTNWGRVTAFVMDAGNLYVLDAPARAVWVYTGRDGTYIDRPYFFFGEQTPAQSVIDLVVTGDDLYLLHSDGHIALCSYSRVTSKPTRCEDPQPLVNPFAAYQDIDLFGNAHFTQILFAAPPDPSVLLLDADAQGVMRFAPRTLELQNQFRPTTGTTNPIPNGAAGAVAVGPNHVMYYAVGGQVFYATMP